MKIAYIIVVYKSPEIVERLIKSISHGNSDCYIHVDKKVGDQQFRSRLEHIPQVYFIEKRAAVNWAGYSLIEALNSSISEILSSGREYQFIVHISGQDYPIKSTNYIYGFLNKHIGKSFIYSEQYPTEWWLQAEPRISKYHLVDYFFRGHTRLERIITLFLPKRKFPLPYILYGAPGSAYWILSIEAAKYLHEFIANHKKVRKYFKYTWGPDEFLINTIIMNSSFKEEVINNNCWYIDWSSGSPHPKILNVSDFPSIQNSDKLYARKFDINVDKDILDLIDNKILAG